MIENAASGKPSLGSCRSVAGVLKATAIGLAICAVLSACGIQGRQGIFDSQEELPPPDMTVSDAAIDGLDALDRQEIARVVGGIDLNAPPASSVAQIPQTATYAIIEEVALDETAGPGCRRFTSTLIDRRGTRAFSGAVCPTPTGWALLQPGETTIADVLPGVGEEEGETGTATFIETPTPASTGPEITSTSVPVIGSDLVDQGLFGAAVDLTAAQ